MMVMVTPARILKALKAAEKFNIFNISKMAIFRVKSYLGQHMLKRVFYKQLKLEYLLTKGDDGYWRIPSDSAKANDSDKTKLQGHICITYCLL